MNCGLLAPAPTEVDDELLARALSVLAYRLAADEGDGAGRNEALIDSVT